MPQCCSGAEKPCRLLEVLLNKQGMLEGKRSVFLETKQKKKKLANLESCKRSSGQEYIHLMGSLGNLPKVLGHAGYCCTPHGPWRSLSVTALKGGQVFQVLAAHSCVSVAVFCIHIKTLGILQTAFPNIESLSDQNQRGASVSNYYQSTATKLLFLKAAFQRVFIPIASEERVLILLPIMYD